MNEHESVLMWMARLNIVLAATAGAVTGAVLDKGLTLQGKATAFFIGLSGAMFLGPMILERIFPGQTMSSQVAGCYYLMGATMNAALPPFLKFVAKKAGDPLSFLRTQGGGS